MIHEDEDGPPVLDFSWYAFIGRTRLGLTYRQVGHMTLALFCRLWAHYKNAFDTELLMRRAGVTYAEARRAADREEEWL